MTRVSGSDLFSRPLESWRDANHLFRALTLLCHWRECTRRRGSAVTKVKAS